LTSNYTWRPVSSSDTEKSEQSVPFQGSGIIGLGFLTLEERPIRCTETSVRNYHW